MASNRTRLLFATLLSTGGFAATTAYFQATAPPKSTTTTVAAIAYARNVDGIHQVTHAGSQISSNVQDGDPLFLGDKITTGDQGSMLVKFSNSAQMLELDSDTNLILTQSGQAIVVDLLEGYVKTQGAGALKVKASNGQLEDLKGDTVLAKDKIQGLQVIDPSSNHKPASAQGVVWAYPLKDIKTELNPDDPTSIRFKWDGSTDKQKISVEWGATRKTTNEHPQVVAGTSRFLDTVLPIGRHYWRWVVINATDDKVLYQSAPSQIIVSGAFPPVIATPLQGQKVYLNSLTDKITMKWSGQKRFDRYRVEISTARSFARETMLSSQETENSEFSFNGPKYGEYFWRVTGHVIAAKEGAADRWLRTKIYQFRTLPKEHEKTKLFWITAGGRKEFTVGKPAIDLVWDAENRKPVHSYKFKIADTRDRVPYATPQVLTTSKVHLAFNEAGPHFAQVEAYNNDQELIGTSPVLAFDMESLPILRAPAFVNDESVFNANARGQINLVWSKLEGAKTYIVDLKDPAGHVQTHQTPVPNYAFSKLRPGRYELRLSAIDSFGRTGQISSPKVINVSNKSAVGTIKIKKVQIQ